MHSHISAEAPVLVQLLDSSYSCWNHKSVVTLRYKHMFFLRISAFGEQVTTSKRKDTRSTCKLVTHTSTIKIVNLLSWRPIYISTPSDIKLKATTISQSLHTLKQNHFRLDLIYILWFFFVLFRIFYPWNLYMYVCILYWCACMPIGSRLLHVYAHHIYLYADS